jgi:hypothetical protein
MPLCKHGLCAFSKSPPLQKTQGGGLTQFAFIGSKRESIDQKKRVVQARGLAGEIADKEVKKYLKSK